MYRLIDKFTDHSDWNVSGGNISLETNDWPHLMGTRGGEGSLKLSFSSFISTSYIKKSFSNSISFVSELGTKYESLTFLVQRKDSLRGFDFSYLFPENFELKFSIHKGGVKLREWFVPIKDSGYFIEVILDIKPLRDAGGFDEIRFSANKETSATFYISDFFIKDEDIEHSLKETLLSLLDEKLVVPFGVIDDSIPAGSDKILIKPAGVLVSGMLLRFGDEIHILDRIDSDGDGFLVSFKNGKDGLKLKSDISRGTPLEMVIPATYKDIADSDSILPVFFISSAGHSEREFEKSPSSIDRELSSYVVDPTGDRHTVGIRRGEKAFSIPIELHIYSSTLDIALEMRRFCRFIFDDDSYLRIVNTDYDYDFEGAEDLDEWDSVEAAPHTIINLTVSVSEAIKVLDYKMFPPVKKVDVTYIPVAGVLI